MTREALYRLSEATVVEPLVNQWPVWPQLISPVTASLQLLKHQLPTLRSYLEDPQSHARLARDPEFAGSPFSDIPPHRVEEVRALLSSTEQRQKKNLDFARAVSEFQNRFVAEAHGQSLEPFYEELPEEMRGYVELIYDYYHHPGVRFLEGLLYESEYYDASLQSLRIFQVARDDARPFFMSTPRLIDEGQIDWRIPFASPAVDRLFRLDLEPQPLAAIREILNLKSDDERHLLPLLSEGAASTSPKWREQKARIRYFGHACVLIEWNGVSILTDPYVPVMPVEGGLARYSYQDLPEKIDYALVTHSHQDHFALETLLRLRQRIGCLVVPKSYGLLCGDISLKLMARKMNFRQVMELDTLESISLPEGEIVGVPFMGEHGDLAHGKMAYVVRAGKEQVLFGADSDCLDRQMYRNLRRILGPVETVFLGTESVGAPLTWTNGPLFFKPPTREQNRTRRYHGCDAESALNILEALGAKRIFNYAMGKEPWLEHLLGLGLSEDSPQLKESGKLLARARGRGFIVARRPFGKEEIYLDRDASTRPSQAVMKPEGVASPGTRMDSASAEKDWAAQLSYWKNQLADPPPPLALPVDSASPATHARAFKSLGLPVSLAERLRVLSQQHECDFAVVFLAAFKALLLRYSEQDEMLVCAIISNQPHSEKKRQGAACGNAVVLRTDLSGQPDFLTLLAREREVVMRAYANLDVPFGRVMKALQAEPGRGPQPPLFRVLFIFNCAPAETETLIRNINDVGASDLVLSLSEEEQGRISVSLEYEAGLIEEATAALMLEHYRAMLESISAHPQRALTELPLDTEGPEEGSLSDSNGLPAINDAEDQFVF